MGGGEAQALTERIYGTVQSLFCLTNRLRYSSHTSMLGSGFAGWIVSQKIGNGGSLDSCSYNVQYKLSFAIVLD